MEFLITTIFALLLFPTAEQADSVMLQSVDIVSSVKLGSNGSDNTSQVTTLDSHQLEHRHLYSVKELSTVAPNFYQPDYGSRMTSSIYVRGFGSRIDQPVVGMNIDEMPIMNKNCYDFDFFDIDRVQVLRGAQGFLFGRNTSGGAINIYTLSPLKFQGKRLMLGYGNGNSFRVKAAHYARYGGKLGWSASVNYSHSDGFFNNQERGEKCDGGDNVAVRLRVQYLIGERWSLDNIFNAGYTDEGGWAYRLYDADKNTMAPVAYNDDCSYRRFSIQNGLLLKHYSDWATFSSATCFQYMDDRMELDNDFLPLDYFTMGQYQKEHSVTQEFVVRSHDTGALRFMAGVFGFYKHNDMSAPVRFKQYGIDNLILKNANGYYYHLLGPDRELSFRDDNFVINDDFDIPAYGAAAYLQLGYKIGNFDICGGLRVDYERSEMEYSSWALLHYKTYRSHMVYNPLLSTFIGDNSMDALELLPAFSLSYNGDVGNVYVSVRKGFKAGGFNTQLFSDILQNKLTGELIGNRQEADASSTVYGPETSWNYEIGTHISPFADGRLNISAALFYIDCRDQQLTVFPKGMGTGRLMSNAGKSFSYGGELAIKYNIGRFTVDAAYGYTHAEFKEYESGTNDYSGKRLPFAPCETVSANVSYRLPASGNFASSLSLNVGWNGIGRIYWNEENTLQQPFYGLWSASIVWEKGHFGASLWSKNLFDKEYSTFYFKSIGNDFFAQGKPLQAGISLYLKL